MASSPPNTTPPSLGDLPAELVLEIAESMALSDKYHLMCTCRGMYAIFRNIIYDDDFNSADPCALRWACAYGFIDIINEILDKGVSTDRIFSENVCRRTTRPDDSLYFRDHAVTPLATAVAFRQLEAIEVLLQRGANVNFAPDEYDIKIRWTFGDDDFPRLTQFNPEDLMVDGQPRSFVIFSPLCWAVNPQLPGYPEERRSDQDRLTEQIVHTLIAYGADVNRKERWLYRCMNPLSLPVVNQYAPVSIVRILQDAGAKAATAFDDDTFDPWMRSDAETRSTTEPFHYFVMSHLYYPPVKEQGDECLSSVDEEKLRLVLSKAAPEEFDIMLDQGFIQLLMSPPTPVMLEITRIFLHYLPMEFLSHPDADKFLPLIVTIDKFPETLSKIEENSNWTLADICKGYTKLFSMLIEGGAPTDRPDGFLIEAGKGKGANTALTALCGDTYPEGVEVGDFVNFFVSKGASPNGRDSRGFSALYYASQNLLINAATALLSLVSLDDLSADIGDRDVGHKWGSTMLLTACNANREGTGNNTPAAFADLLLKHGANVNEPEDSGEFPLHCACRTADSDLVHVLLKHGADAKSYYDEGASYKFSRFYPSSRYSVLWAVIYRYGFLQDVWRDEHEDDWSEDEPTIQIVEILLEHGAEWTDEDQKLLHRMIEKEGCKYPEKVMLVLNERASKKDDHIDRAPS